MKANKVYYLLTLSHNNVHVYKGDNYGLERVIIKNLPDNMKGTLNIDEYPNMRETHAIAPASEGKGSEGYHGQYNVHQTDKKMLLEFFRRVDKSLHKYLLNKREPLYLAGVGYLLPIYRKVNTYPNLSARTVEGNVDYLSMDDLFQKAQVLFAKPRPASYIALTS